MIAIPISIVFLFLLYLFMISPKKTKDMEKYKNLLYAHRGLHNSERAENSMSAFRAAVDAGYGIELDVRLSKDGELVVFHDDTLDRVCGREGNVIDFSADELSTFKLSGTEDGIPKFADVLALVNGKVPLLVEIKESRGTSVAEATCKMLAEYKGDFIVESFNPLSLGVVKKELPKVSRGILSHRYFEYDYFKGKILFFLLQTLLLNFVCRPAFIAYDHRHANAFGLKFVRTVFGIPTIAWTVRSEEEEKLARENGFDGIIFEDYTP